MNGSIAVLDRRLRKVADRLTPWLAPGRTLPPELVVPATQRLLAARAAAAALHQQIQALGGLRLPPDWSPAAPDAQVRPEQARWVDSSPWYATWQRDGATWRAELTGEGLLPVRRWGAVLTQTDALTAAGLSGYADDLLGCQIDMTFAEVAYRRGLAQASLVERLHAGGLDYFDPERHGSEIAQFEMASDQLRTALTETSFPACRRLAPAVMRVSSGAGWRAHLIGARPGPISLRHR